MRFEIHHFVAIFLLRKDRSTHFMSIIAFACIVNFVWSNVYIDMFPTLALRSISLFCRLICALRFYCFALPFPLREKSSFTLNL